MKILFDLRTVGLGNNGGSTTIIKSANTLQKLGCDVKIIDTGKNQNTWVKLEVPHLIVKWESGIPDSDFIIATGYKSVLPTVLAPKRCGIKCHYVRAWEIWQGDDQWIYSNVLKPNTIKFVNSIGLQDKIKKYNIESHVVYPGYDFELFYPVEKKKKDYIVLGGLHHKKHAAIKRISWLFDTHKELLKKGLNVKLYLMGNTEPPKDRKYDKYIQNPSVEEKNLFYNDIDVWLSTSMCEGLHLPPAEAMLTECPAVTTSAELSGTKDYIINGETGVITENYLERFSKAVEMLCTNEKFRNELGKKARQKILSIGSREDNMKKFIDLLQGIKNNEVL